MPEELNQEQTITEGADSAAQPNPREAAMDAIGARHNAAIASELGLPLDLVTPPSADPDADPDDAVAAEARAALAREAAASDQVARQMAEPAVPGVAASTPAPKVIDNPDEYMVRVKVDGQEELRPLSQMVRTEQKEAAATRRLNEAAALRAEAERLTVEARAAAAAGRVPGVPNTATAAPSSDALQMAKEFTTALYGGEQEAAEAIMAQLIGALGRPQSGATPSIDPAAIAAEVEQRIATNSALEKFAADFPEIVRDPYLARVADDQLAAAMAEGKPFAMAVQEAGLATRDWARNVSGSPAGAVPTAPSRDERLNRKQQLDRLPVAAATATSSNEPHIPTPQEVLAEMRRARGLG